MPRKRLTKEERLRRDAFLGSVHRNIMGPHHVHLTGVFPTVEDPPFPGFVYTTGLWSYKHPELVVIGLPWNDSAVTLNRLAHRVINMQVVFKDGSFLSDEEIARVPLKFHACEPTPDDLGYIGVAHEYYNARVPALQVLWPDIHGKYPGDPDYWPFKEGIVGHHPDEVQPLLPR
jgi:hypothetical protein